MALMIRSSAIHAAGCYTTERLPRGRKVAEYTGPRLTKKQADTLYEESPLTYLFGLGDGKVVIDGHCMAMFLNHSCNPNCETDERDGRIWITAIKNIPAGAELTYDYCLYDGGDDPADCNCGSKSCRGTMYSTTEVRKRKAASKGKARRKTKRAAGK